MCNFKPKLPIPLQRQKINEEKKRNIIHRHLLRIYYVLKRKNGKLKNT